ncbi:MAG: hypothetical protein Q4B87_00830 [Candidatus Saccharibacteria bacterium]|nr:hypothetical protein [Candidatus Saccharibacteria bacterium]
MDNRQPFNSGMPNQGQPFNQPVGQPMGQAQPYTGAFNQPINNPQGMMGQPGQPVVGATPISSSNVAQNPITGAPMLMQAPAPENGRKKDVASIVKTIVIIALSLLSVTFIGLFIWMFTQYNAARTDTDGQIAAAVADAVDKNTMKLEEEFTEREKYPYNTFAGPADYGELTFEYPKTWSVYIGKDASKGGDYEAYLNPLEVNTVANTTLMGLRVSIMTQAFDDVVNRYQSEITGEEPKMRLDTITIGQAEQGGTTTANRYTGTIPGTEFSGIVIIFKIRDKTAVLQTDSMLFEGDFNNIIKTVRFNA